MASSALAQSIEAYGAQSGDAGSSGMNVSMRLGPPSRSSHVLKKAPRSVSQSAICGTSSAGASAEMASKAGELSEVWFIFLLTRPVSGGAGQ